MRTRSRDLKRDLENLKRVKKASHLKDDDEDFTETVQLAEAVESESDEQQEPEEDSDVGDDAPIALTFKEQKNLRSKTDMAAKASMLTAQKRAKEARKKKMEPASTATTKVKSEKKKKVKMEEAMQISEDEEDIDVDDNGDDAEEFQVTNKKQLKKSKILKRKKRACEDEGEDAGEGEEPNEFKMTDTFDFRQYLPKGVLEGSDEGETEEEGNDDDIDSDEEFAKAIMEGGFDEDSDEGYNGSDEHVNNRRKKSKKEAHSGSTSVPSTSREPKTPNRRGGRRVRKKHSAVPRVVILNRQDDISAQAIRARTFDFVNQRLFPVDFKSPGPRRMDRATLESLSAKKRARTASLNLA